jgi:glucuronate isomerase
MSEPAPPAPQVESLVLHEDRFFDPDPTIRRIARSLYEETRDLPIVSPHGHVDPTLLANDDPFPEPATLIVIPDHYVFRMLHSQGVPLEQLGIPTRDGTPVERDPRVIWQRFAEHYYLFRGTPTAVWLDYELYHVFGVRKRLSGAAAAAIYDEIAEKLRAPEFRPRALFDRFNIELLATTDSASDPHDGHRRIRESGWRGRVIPTFRPDVALKIAAPEWPAEIDRLAQLQGGPIGDYGSLMEVLRARRAFFKSLGAVATDHDSEVPYTERLTDEQADELFQRARRGDATPADQRRFEAHMLMEMARLSTADGLVMQLHAGSYRNHSRLLLVRFGLSVGGDIPVATEYTRNLRNLLNAYGHDRRFRLIVFTLDETTYARELAPLAGVYPALRLGPAWWFHDSIQGMQRYRQRTTETAGIYNTAGFNDDTRVARHIVDLSDARQMARALAYDLVRDAYRLT